MSLSPLVQFFQSPRFENETIQHRAQLLSFLLNLHGVVAVSVAVLYALIAPELPLIPLVALATCIPALVGRWLIWRGRVSLAALGFIGFLALLMPATALLTRQSVSTVSVISFQFVTIVMAGLLLGGRGALGFMMVTLLINGLLLYAESQGWYVVAVQRNLLVGWTAQAITYGAATALLWMANRLIRESLARARQELAERQQAEASRRKYAERLEILREIDRAILAAHSPEETALAAVARIRGVVTCQRASVNLFDFPAREAILLVINLHGTTQLTPGRRASLEDFGLHIVERLWQGQPFIDNDFLANATASELDQQLLAEGVRSWLMTPLFDQGELIGALNLGWERPGPVNSDEIIIAREVADQLAIAIRQARLFEIQQTEIAQRRQTEARLLESEAHLQLALEAARLGTWRHNFQPDQTIFSERMRSIYGERIPAEATDLIHPDDQSQVNQTLAAVLQNQGAEFALTYRIVMPDGHLRWIESWGQATYDATGQPHSLTGVARDVTDRKLAEVALQHRTRRLETLSMIGRAILRRQSSADIAREALTHLRQLTAADRASVVMFDFERREAQMLAVVGLGEDLWPSGTVLDFDALTLVLAIREEHYSPDILALETRSAFLERLLADGLRCALTLPLLPDENIMGRVHLTAMRPDAFDPEARAIAREVADMLAVALQQARLHEQVQQHASELERHVTERTAQLQAANEELEAFSYSVSHDLRAPLRGIDGFSRLLLEEYAAQLAPGGQRYLDRIRENAQRMGRLIDDLLQFSRLGRQPITKQMVDMTHLVHEALAELRLEIERRQVEFVIADLPAGPADPTLLRQVFVNLLGNALKYTRQRTPARIEVGWREGAYWIQDNGVGFDMKYVDKLFGVFQRLHRADEFEGTGVGLANVRRIIERHGGRIWAEAALDQGATFYFSLPTR